jgi:hypothetical protein
MKQSQFYYLLRRGLFSAGSAIIKNGLVMFNKFTTAGISHPVQGSAEFNGTSDYIDTGAVLIDGPHTIAAWVYSEGSAGAQIVDTRDASQDGVYFYVTNLGQFYYRVNASTIVNTNQYKGQWVYAVVTYDNSTQKLYVDGSLLQFANLSNATIDVANTTKIGRNSYSSAEYFNGNLANVAIWNRALSSDEINSVMWKSYEGLEGAESNGLQAWYSLDDITSPAASLANMEQLATDKDATIENKAAITAAVNALS